MSGCQSQQQDAVPVTMSKPTDSQQFFQEVTQTWGLEFVHQVGSLADYEMPQIMSGGAALADFDRDSFADVLLMNLVPDDAQFYFRNVGQSSLQPASQLAGLIAPENGMGAIVGDIDNDGFPDLYVTCHGPDHLFMNNGDGTFSDVTQASQINAPGWGTAGAFHDLNRDGWLDLIVVNYLQYRPHESCEDSTGIPDFCGPQAFLGAVDLLWENRGAYTEDGGFQWDDLTLKSGLAHKAGKGLGLVCQDFTGDGFTDLYVTNDMEANHLWVQQEDGTFQEEAVLRGVALNWMGEPEASMGVAVADFAGNGTPALFMTHLRGQKNTLYLQDEAGVYSDKTVDVGLSRPSLNYTGFGVAAEDFDHDGDIDLAIANGKVKRAAGGGLPSDESVLQDYAEQNQLLLNSQEGNFTELQSRTDPFLTQNEISRGLATADLDHDGDVDLLLTNCAGPARIFLNEAPKKGHWLRLRLIDPVGNRDGLGAKVVLKTSAGEHTRYLSPSNGYLTTSDFQVHFGIPAETYESIEVHWPDGKSEIHSGGKCGRALMIVRGRRNMLEQAQN